MPSSTEGTQSQSWGREGGLASGKGKRRCREEGQRHVCNSGMIHVMAMSQLGGGAGGTETPEGAPGTLEGLGSDPLSQGGSVVPERGTERHCTSRAAGRAGRESRAVTNPHGPGLCAAFGRVRAWAAVRSLTHRLPWDREGKTAPMTNAPNTMTYCHAMSSRSRSTLTGRPKAPHSPEVNRTSPS